MIEMMREGGCRQCGSKSMFDCGCPKPEPRKILVITADVVEFTGTVTYGFMLDCAPPDELARRMPQHFGVVNGGRDGGHSINVFKGGKGFLFGGGWTDRDSDEHEKMMLDRVPSCTLLMTTATFEWWEGLCAKHGVEFELHHFVGGLRTS